jgi:hypothetical protein
MSARPDDLPTTICMIAAHVVAAVALGWFPRQGELWSAARRASLRLTSRHRRVRSAAVIACQLPALPDRQHMITTACPGQAHSRMLARHGDHATAGRRRRVPPTSITGLVFSS